MRLGVVLTAFLTIALANEERALAAPPDTYGVTPMTPPTLKLTPGPRYGARVRMWQGIPSIERAPKGRLWATWYAGPLSEGSEGNYNVLVTSGDDGRTWSEPVAVYDASTLLDGTTGDPHLWLDPRGRLWWFVNRSLRVGEPHERRTVWAFCADKPDDAEPKWRPPVFVGYGVALNKPLVLSNGDWLRPVDLFKPDPLRTQFYVSRDEGQSYALQSKLPVKDAVFSEHMAVERKDGSLLTLVRTSYGIAQAESTDRGATWLNERPFTTERGINTRFFIGRLKSGALLLVVNDHAKSRTNMTAMLSDDDGRTWPHKLLLDDRRTVSYPDACQAADGSICITYDRGRYHKDEQEILFAKVAEADIRAGKVTHAESRLRQVINRLADSGGGVHSDREPILLIEAYEKEQEAKRKK